MKFKTTKGKEVAIDIRPSKYPMRDEFGCRSKYQYNVGQILKGIFHGDVILEDFYVPEEGVYLDFFIPRTKIAVEVNGEQHDKFVPYFHRNKKGFADAQDRDSRKKEWCRINGIVLCSIPWGVPLEDIRSVFVNAQNAGGLTGH